MAVAAVAAFGFGRLPGEMRDFEVYWTAATRALSSEPLYRVSDGHYQFKYLPAFAVLTSAAALVPLPLAKAAWFVASVALIAMLIALSLALLPSRRKATWWLIVMVIVAMGKFYGHELGLGQVNLAFAVIVLLGVLMLRKGQGEAAAILLVVAMVVKPYAVVLVAWLVFRGGIRASVAAGLAAVVVLLLPVVFYGGGGTIDLHRAWWLTVTASTAPNLTNPDNVSLAGFFAKWLGSGTAAARAAAVAGLLLATGIALVVGRGKDVARRETLEAAVLLAAIPLLSPQGWDYVFLLATPAVALVVNYDRELPPALRILSWGAILTIGLSLFDLMGRQRYGVFMEWSVITICFLVVISALAYLRMRRVA